MSEDLGARTHVAEARTAPRAFALLAALLLMEGVLRKWVLPQYHEYIFFIRDPVAVYALWSLVKSRVPPVHPVLFFNGILLTAMASLVELARVVSLGGTSLAISYYGWRNYFLYLPLPFLVARVLRPSYTRGILRALLVIAAPVAALVVAQALSSPLAAINVGMGEDTAFAAMRVSAGVTRAAGLFTSTAGQSLFCAVVLAAGLAGFSDRNWLSPRWKVVAWLAVGASAVMTAVSGSRTAVLLVVLVLAVYLFTIAIRARVRVVSSTVMLSVAGALALAVLVPAFASGPMEALADRFGSVASTGIEGQFGVLGRVGGELTRFYSYMGEVPVFGYGLGTGGNAARGTGAGTTSPEDGLSQNVHELGPPLGILFIAWRLALTLALARAGVRMLLLRDSRLPVLLFAAIGPYVAYNLLTGNGSTHGITWIVAAMVLSLESEGVDAPDEG